MRNGLFLGIAVVVCVGAYFLMSSISGTAREKALERSVMGNDALRIWLQKDDIAVVKSNPRLNPLATDFSLRILPLADVALDVQDPEPQNAQEAFYQTSQREMSRYVFTEKLFDLPSLVILPKWRTGFASVKVAYETVLIPARDVQQLLPEVGLSTAEMIREAELLTRDTLKFSDGTKVQVEIYRPQVFDRTKLAENLHGDGRNFGGRGFDQLCGHTGFRTCLLSVGP